MFQQSRIVDETRVIFFMWLQNNVNSAYRMNTIVEGKNVELVQFFFITTMPSRIPPRSFRSTRNGTASKYCLTYCTHRTWRCVIIDYFWRLRKPCQRRSRQCSSHLFQLAISRRLQEGDQRQIGRKVGEVCEARRPVLWESAPASGDNVSDVSNIWNNSFP